MEYVCLYIFLCKCGFPLRKTCCIKHRCHHFKQKSAHALWCCHHHKFHHSSSHLFSFSRHFLSEGLRFQTHLCPVKRRCSLGFLIRTIIELLWVACMCQNVSVGSQMPNENFEKNKMIRRWSVPAYKEDAFFLFIAQHYLSEYDGEGQMAHYAGHLRKVPWQTIK